MTNPSGPSQEQEQLQQQVEQRLGTKLEGVGVLEDVVGIGGMATVYRAERPNGQSVAVKLMHQHLADKGTLRKRFLREAKILDQVDHPNAISVYGQGTAPSGEAYFVMELLDGWEVETVWKKKDRQFPVAEALEIAMQALAALHAYHDSEVLHRDLKPSNLFLTKSGQVKLIDFGVARFHGTGTQHTRSGTALGTPAYMAPEQAMGKVDILDRRTDVYGIGAVLFTLLAGRRVHEADSNDETLVMAATQPADSLARHAPDVPTDVVQLVDKALSWDPDDRFSTAAEMRRAIQGLLDDSGEGLDREEKVSEEEREEAEEAVSEDVADVIVDISDEAIDGMQIMFDRIESMLNSARMYKWNHDKTKQKARHAFEAFVDIMDLDEGEVYWEVRPHSFEIVDICLWEPEEPFDLIPYNLFLDGLRRIQLRSSLTPGELIEFARWMNTDPEHELPPEDDLATILWDMELPSVDANIVSTPSIIDPSRDDLLQAEMQELMNDAEMFLGDGGIGQQVLLAMRGGAYAEAEAMADGTVSSSTGILGKDFTLVRKGMIDKNRVEQLNESIKPSNQQWKRRIEEVVTELWTETTDPVEDEKFLDSIQDLMEHYLAMRRLKPLLRILIRSYARLQKASQRQFLVNNLLDHEFISELADAVRVTTTPGAEDMRGYSFDFKGFGDDDEEEDDDTVDKKLLKLFGRLLKIVPEEHFTSILQEFVGGGEAYRKTIAKYIRRYAPSHERQIAELFDALDVDAIKMLMRILADAGTEPAFEELSDILADPEEELELRKHALKLLRKHFDLTRNRFDLTEVLGELVTDKNKELRFAALKLARKVGYKRMVPIITERAESREFNLLPVPERREVLQTLIALSRSKGLQVAIDMAKGHGVIPDDNRQKSRVLAIRVLGEMGENQDALEAVKKGSGGWWWNSDEIRDAAETAAEQIERRLEGAQ